DIRRRPPARRNERAEVRGEAVDRAEKVMRVIDAMREHVGELAGAAQRRDLPPTELAIAPVLKAGGAEMIDRAEVAATSEVLEISHRRDKPIRERGHMLDAGVFSGAIGFPRIGIVQRDRLLA